MNSLWNDSEASSFQSDLAQRVYTSRLLGREKSLVLHGGGNTSVKIRETNLLGQEEDILYVKGSGWDLETIEEAGFSPVRMDHLLALSKLEKLSDAAMVNELKSHMTRASAPTPSIETILHAILPHKYVDHTHADSVIAITNTPGGPESIRSIYGHSVVVIPYIMPGFDLSAACARILPSGSSPETLGIILLNHGVFSFGATARESYERMIQLVSQAEDFLQKRNAWNIPMPSSFTPTQPLRLVLASLRKNLSEIAGTSMILTTRSTPLTSAFVNRTDLSTLSQQGSATPDHIIRTKRVPMLGRDVGAYAQDYKSYFDRCTSQAGTPLTMLDPAPRVILDPEFGMATAGRTLRDAEIVADLYHHTMEILSRATALESYKALSEFELFKIEYWELEQAKLRNKPTLPLFAGEVVLITGAASGIGKACAEIFLQRGAAVIGLDLHASVSHIFSQPEFLGIVCDVTEEQALQQALESGVRRFGGLDMLVLNAGIFPVSTPIANLPSAEWDRTLRINLDSNLSLLREAHPLLKLAPQGGRVVVIGSKNVPAPGPGAAAYSASKAALTQLARTAALEWGADHIRVNVIHPNAVFDTAIWTEDVLQRRAAAYKMSVEEYKTNNVLHTTVTSHDVAELAADMCGPAFAKTTAAQVPVDGGNERVI